MRVSEPWISVFWAQLCWPLPAGSMHWQSEGPHRIHRRLSASWLIYKWEVMTRNRGIGNSSAIGQEHRARLSVLSFTSVWLWVSCFVSLGPSSYILYTMRGDRQSLPYCKCVCMLSLSVMSNSLQPHGLVPLSMGFSRQEYWSGLPFPSPGGSAQPRDRTYISCILNQRR